MTFAKQLKLIHPNAVIEWNVSPWLGETTINTWWGYFKTSPYISFKATTGGLVNKKYFN